jgi:hypothetical protein
MCEPQLDVEQSKREISRTQASEAKAKRKTDKNKQTNKQTKQQTKQHHWDEKKREAKDKNKQTIETAAREPAGRFLRFPSDGGCAHERRHSVGHPQPAYASRSRESKPGIAWALTVWTTTSVVGVAAAAAGSVRLPRRLQIELATRGHHG